MSLTDLRDDLDAALLDDLPEPEDPDTAPAPTLEGLGDADKALRRLRWHEREMRRIEAVAEDEIRRITVWRDAELAKREKRRSWWQSVLEGWARAHAAATGTKTVSLPSGEVRLRKSPPKVEALADPDEYVPAKFQRVKRSWDKRALADLETGPAVDDQDDVPEGYVAHLIVTPDGEMVPNVVRWVPTRDSFSVKTEATS